MSSTSIVQATPVRAGQKRKRADTIIIYGSTDEAGTAAEETDADLPESPLAGPSTLKPRQYQCTYSGCTKAYTKPSRLDEHLRSHTGERPFKCAQCSKAYLRESHLRAHMRTHMDATKKKFVCEVENCGKAFWTAQQLKVHAQVHQGVKLFICTVVDCDAKFSKHHQLRAHVAEAHCPPGTKPFRCEHDGCNKSFSTNQKLTAHAKTHEAKRYVCLQPSCTADGAAPPVFAKWTALQQHMRAIHPPTCPHATCGGRIFASQANLRAHLALHNARKVEDALQLEVDDADADSDDSEPPRKRRRCEDVVGRNWECHNEFCDKAFKSKKALDTHVKVNHLNRRDFVCTVAACGRAFGYKHLLQRHMLTVHTEDASDTDPDIGAETDADPISAIDFITGKHYLHRNDQKRQQGQTLVACPYPAHFCHSHQHQEHEEHTAACRFVFSRAYDLRRHLKAAHGEEWEKDEVDAWVRRRKKELATEASGASEAAP